MSDVTTTPAPALRRKTLLAEVSLHVIVCIAVIAFPFLVAGRESYDEEWVLRLRHMLGMQVAFLSVFYVNYLLLVPKMIFKGKTWAYVIVNVLLVGLIIAAMQMWHDAIMATMVERGLHRHDKPGPPKWIFLARDTFTMALIIGMSIAIRMSKKWVQAENARKEAERSRTEAELKNLRNQINPHFLLNTLNNIYALIMFDTPRAQEAVQELSRLLRYVLYDNQQRLVALPKEAEFIRNYIELMRIRMPANVTMDIDIGIDPSSKTMIAPLIFISLIENSFKHGISPTQQSHITIRLSEKDGLVTCHTGNSNHPKQSNDKSGSGIGLGQVRRRLDLIYPMRYRWTCTADEKLYVSTLTIDTRHDTTQLHHRR